MNLTFPFQLLDQHNSYITCHEVDALTILLYAALNSFLRWTFQTQLRNARPLFSYFMGRKQREEYGRRAPKILQLLLVGSTGAEKKNRKASGSCLGRMVLVELCKLDVSLTQTAKLEGQLITVQFRGNGRQNCIYSHAQLKDSYIWKGSFNINNNIYLPKTPAALWPSGNQLPIPKTPSCSQPTIHTDFDFTLSENFIFDG